MEAPKVISNRTILHTTYYDKMPNEERGIVFKAYKFNPNDKNYYLIKKELLTDSIIKKIASN